MQKFYGREYQRCVADVFKVVSHEFARRVNVMLGVAGRVRDFPDLAVAVVGSCFTRSHCGPEIVENVGVKTDPLARSKAEMPLSLSETQSCWQLIPNWAMLLPYARGLLPNLVGVGRSVPVAGLA